MLKTDWAWKDPAVAVGYAAECLALLQKNWDRDIESGKNPRAPLQIPEIKDASGTVLDRQELAVQLAYLSQVFEASMHKHPPLHWENVEVCLEAEDLINRAVHALKTYRGFSAEYFSGSVGFVDTATKSASILLEKRFPPFFAQHKQDLINTALSHAGKEVFDYIASSGNEKLKDLVRHHPDDKIQEKLKNAEASPQIDIVGAVIKN